MISNSSGIRSPLQPLIRRIKNIIEEAGYLTILFIQCFFWLVLGKQKKQPVRMAAVVKEAMEIGIFALFIISVLCFAVGIMLAIHSIDILKTYGFESKVILAVAKSVTQEFSPLIVSILVAGRSGSAITARIGSMKESQEIDALRVIGINPIRFLAAPIMLAMIVIMPCLTLLGDLVAVLGSAVYSIGELKISLATYMQRTLDVVEAADIWKGLLKSLLFGILIALVAIGQGFQVSGGAEGVGRATTRSVVISICLIIITDMVATYFLSRVSL